MPPQGRFLPPPPLIAQVILIKQISPRAHSSPAADGMRPSSSKYGGVRHVPERRYVPRVPSPPVRLLSPQTVEPFRHRETVAVAEDDHRFVRQRQPRFEPSFAPVSRQFVIEDVKPLSVRRKETATAVIPGGIRDSQISHSLCRGATHRVSR